ncbi:MAG: hypothetical protein JWM68_4715 [Verrucomicrobiales bacterium]|nr:hypothetical protein [Verrucomicrobiales bacterium]
MPGPEAISTSMANGNKAILSDAFEVRQERRVNRCFAITFLFITRFADPFGG